MELIKIENNQLLLADKVIDQIRNLEIEKKLIEEKEKEFKEKLIKIYEDNGIDRSSNFESYDKSLKISYTPKTSGIVVSIVVASTSADMFISSKTPLYTDAEVNGSILVGLGFKAYESNKKLKPKTLNIFYPKFSTYKLYISLILFIQINILSLSKG